MFGSKLSMQLVPNQCYGRNLRKILKSKSWKTLSMSIRGRDKVCVHCGAMAEHCHEEWEWVVCEGKLVQRLVGLEAVCKDCHDFMHIGRVISCESQDRVNHVLGHAMRILDMSEGQMIDYTNMCLNAHNAVSWLLIGEKMDLAWIYDLPAAALGMEASVWTPIWDEIDTYLNGEQEYHKEENAGIPD